jgi:outer membrane protein OmpA-like peptidoglycan-associated protein
MLRPLTCALGAVLLLAGCETAPDGTQRVSGAGTGAAAGAVLGGVLGAVIDDDRRGRGALIGAAAGGALGGGVGYLFDRQQRDFEEALAGEQAARVAEVERVREDLLKISLQNEILFDFARADLKPAFRPTLEKLADVLVKYDRSVATIVGHTDSIGSEAYNEQLSVQRAEAVVGELMALGVPGYRLAAEGRGEREPRADNATEAGRQLNRRVEIFVRPDSSTG